jgi:Phosphotransferase enzyme family
LALRTVLDSPWISGTVSPVHVKRRERPVPGSIPDVLAMFRSELRFYREIAPVLGVRVPRCYRAEETADGTLLVLEELSAWQPGADPVAAACLLSGMHRRWESRAPARWPWLRPAGAGADLVAALFGRAWARLAGRGDLPAAVLTLGGRLAARAADAERATATAGPLTLVHGDASAPNMRTGPGGEIALLDWEDVSAAPGVADLAWLLVSSVEPAGWGEVITAYGAPPGLLQVLPSAVVQGLLSLSGIPAGSAEAQGWITRLGAAAGLLAGSEP